MKPSPAVLNTRPPCLRGDAFDHLAKRRHLGRRARLVGLRPRGIAGDVERNDGGEFAGLGVVRHRGLGLEVRVPRHATQGRRLMPSSA